LIRTAATAAALIWPALIAPTTLIRAAPTTLIRAAPTLILAAPTLIRAALVSTAALIARALIGGLLRRLRVGTWLRALRLACLRIAGPAWLAIATATAPAAFASWLSSGCAVPPRRLAVHTCWGHLIGAVRSAAVGSSSLLGAGIGRARTRIARCALAAAALVVLPTLASTVLRPRLLQRPRLLGRARLLRLARRSRVCLCRGAVRSIGRITSATPAPSPALASWLARGTTRNGGVVGAVVALAR